MPGAEEILNKLTAIVQQGMAFSPFIRVILLVLVGWCIAKRRVLTGYLAAYAGLVATAASVMAIGFEDQELALTFFLLFPLGLLWGREALLLPPNMKAGPVRISIAAIFGLFAFFYPEFVEGVRGAVLSAPLGIVPCPTLVLLLSVVMLTGRAYGLYTVVPTWVVAAFYGVVGVFYLGVKVDWVLLAALVVSVVLYFATRREKRPKGKRFKRKR